MWGLCGLMLTKHQDFIDKSHEAWRQKEGKTGEQRPFLGYTKGVQPCGAISLLGTMRDSKVGR